MKTLFLTFGDVNMASSRLRAYWIAEKLDDAEAMTWAEMLKNKDTNYLANPLSNKMDYQNIVCQKMIDPNLAAMWRKRGLQVIWDICDPVWWFDPELCARIVRNVDQIICSSSGLKNDLDEWLNDYPVPTKTIMDRVKLEHYFIKHEAKQSDPVKLIWFGFAQNRITLQTVATNLERLAANGYRFEFTVYDDYPEYEVWSTDKFKTHYKRWSLEDENEVIASHDIAILPPYPGPWGQVKSTNKMQTAWSCNVPVVTGLDYKELEQMVREDYYNPEKLEYIPSLIKHQSIEQSVEEWREVLR